MGNKPRNNHFYSENDGGPTGLVVFGIVCSAGH